MRPQDKVLFQAAAASLKLWILVRRTNVASLKYIGKPGYVPKRMDCKAKTADYNIGKFELAGLVVDPDIHPKAFKSSRLVQAQQTWKQMEDLVGGTYNVESRTSNKHFGCLMLHGNYIHGDYDLYDIIDPKQPQRNLALVSELFGMRHFIGANTKKVMDFINPRIGTPMIQHGGEAQYADHSEQAIDVFGPAGEDFTVLNEFSIRGIYDTAFRGRKNIGKPQGTKA